MSELNHKLNSIWNTAAPPDTKRVYQNQLDLFYEYSPIIKNLQNLIKCPSEILQKELEGYCDFLNERVKKDEMSPPRGEDDRGGEEAAPEGPREAPDRLDDRGAARRCARRQDRRVR